MQASPTTKWEIRSKELSAEITQKSKERSALEEKVRDLESSRKSIEEHMNKNVIIYNNWIIDSAKKLISEKVEIANFMAEKESLEEQIVELFAEIDKLNHNINELKIQEKGIKIIETKIAKLLKEEDKQNHKLKLQSEKLSVAQSNVKTAKLEEKELTERLKELTLQVKKLDGIYSRREKVLNRQEVKVKSILRQHGKTDRKKG